MPNPRRQKKTPNQPDSFTFFDLFNPFKVGSRLAAGFGLDELSKQLGNVDIFNPSSFANLNPYNVFKEGVQQTNTFLEDVGLRPPSEVPTDTAAEELASLYGPRERKDFLNNLEELFASGIIDQYNYDTLQPLLTSDNPTLFSLGLSQLGEYNTLRDTRKQQETYAATLEDLGKKTLEAAGLNELRGVIDRLKTQELQPVDIEKLVTGAKGQLSTGAQQALKSIKDQLAARGILSGTSDQELQTQLQLQKSFADIENQIRTGARESNTSIESIIGQLATALGQAETDIPGRFNAAAAAARAGQPVAAPAVNDILQNLINIASQANEIKGFNVANTQAAIQQALNTLLSFGQLGTQSLSVLLPYILKNKSAQSPQQQPFDIGGLLTGIGTLGIGAGALRK